MAKIGSAAWQRYRFFPLRLGARTYFQGAHAFTALSYAEAYSWAQGARASAAEQELTDDIGKIESEISDTLQGGAHEG